MKKVFTLLTLLLAVCSGAWAETYTNEAVTVTWADPSTISSGTALPAAAVLSSPWAGTSSGTGSWDDITYTVANSNQTFTFTLTPYPGLTFTPKSVEFDMVKFGSDNCFATVDIVYGDKTENQLANLNDKTDICRNKADVNADKRHKTYTLDAEKAGTGAVTLKINLSPASSKTMGVANVVITGTVSGTTEDITSYTITAAANDDDLGSVSGSGSYIADATATLTATAKEGGVFVKWQKDGEDFSGNTSATITPTVTANATYTAIFKALYTVTYDLGTYAGTTTKVLNNYKAGGFNEKYADAEDKYTIPSYAHRYLYREGYRLTGWTDGINTYNTGEKITLTGNTTLTPVWTSTTQTLAVSSSEKTVTWNLRYSEILFNAWQGSSQVGYYTKPLEGVNGETIAVPMTIDATSGKIDNSSRTDKDNAQTNIGTKFTIPAIKGMTISIAEANAVFSTTTIAGSTEYEGNGTKSISYTYTGDASTIDIVINEDNQYLKTIAVTYPAQTVAITPAKEYTSFSCDKALDFSSFDGELDAYVVSTLTTTEATLTKVTEAPANTGLVLKKTSGTTFYVPIVASATAVGTNYLEASVTATDVAANSTYVLSDGKFSTFTGTEIPACKAYMNIPSGGARNLSFSFEGTTTGINAIENAETINGIYNLNGQRVSQPTRGLYIVNGRKVVIK